MSNIEKYKKEIIQNVRENIRSEDLFYCCCVKSYDEYFTFMNNMTFDEIVAFVNRLVKMFGHNLSLDFVTNINNRIIDIKIEINADILRNEIATIKDSVQNTTDVVNLFTDIDKNRNNLEDKVNKLEQKIDNLESSINQILNLLQKS